MRVRVLISIIASACFWRVCFSSGALANFSPIGAIALFGGSYFFNKKIAVAVILLAIGISDLALNYFVYFGELKFFYDGIIFNYLSIALIVFIGSLIKKVKFESLGPLKPFRSWSLA